MTDKEIDAKKAVVLAATYYADVTGDTSGVTIEEIVKAADGSFWEVTLGTYDRDPMRPYMMESKKVYKKFEIDAKTGQVLSMKIRQM